MFVSGFGFLLFESPNGRGQGVQLFAQLGRVLLRRAGVLLGGVQLLSQTVQLSHDLLRWLPTRELRTQ